jgi:predicted phosphodiesterase
MKTIIFSDCHGRPDLITNVLDHANDWDRAIFAGDVLDIGTDPLECIDILLENNIELLWGNHDLAPILGKHIHPVSDYDTEVYNKIRSIKHCFRIASYQDDILLTHAGLSQFFYDNYFDIDINNTKEISDYLNHMSLESVWNDQSPIWFRPSKWYDPKVGLRQIAGHTPPDYFKYYNIAYPDYYTVDPYSINGFGTDRYRYAVIENSGIQIFDSNPK